MNQPPRYRYPAYPMYPMYQPTQPMQYGYPGMFKKRSSPMLGFWGKRILAIVVFVIIVWLLYEYGCDIPIVNILCPLFKLIGDFFSAIATGLGWIAGIL